MRVCPECGHIDRTMWRQNKWRTNVDFIKDEYPEDVPEKVWEEYEKKRSYATDEHYAYRLCHKQGIIERILIEEWDYCGGPRAFHIPRERVDHREDPSQTKLIVPPKEREICM